MRRKYISVITVIILAVVATAALQPLTRPAALAKAEGRTTIPLNITASVDVKVIRNGKVVTHYRKAGDPITIQWYHMLINNLFGLVRTSQKLIWYDVGGTARYWMDTEEEGYNPKAYIALGQGTGTPSRNDYSMFSEVMRDAAAVDLTDDTQNSKYVITYTKTFTSDSTFNLTEVGLLLEVDYCAGGTTVCKTFVLLAHDVIDSPINVSVNDAVSVTYTIEVPYDTSGPFTKNFYAILINYYLGYKGSTGSYLPITTEGGTTYSYFDNYDNDKRDSQKLYFEVGSGSSSVSPLWETTSLGNKVAEARQDYTHVNIEYYENSTAARIKWVVSYTFTSSSTITEVGTSILDDYGRRYLLMYFPLGSPVSVQANSGLRVELEVVIPFS